MSCREILISIKSDLQLVGMLGRAFTALAQDSFLSRSRVGLVELAVVEAVTNTIEHAYRNDDGFTIELTMQLSKDELRVVVADFGLPMPETVIEKYTSGPREITLDTTDIDALPEGGWGTSLVANLCDEVLYERHATTNVLTLICRNTDELQPPLKEVV